MAVNFDPSSLLQSVQSLDTRVQSDLSQLTGGTTGSALGSDKADLGQGKGGDIKSILQALEKMIEDLMKQLQQANGNASSGGQEQPSGESSPQPSAGGSSSHPATGQHGGGKGVDLQQAVAALEQAVTSIEQAAGITPQTTNVSTN